MMDALVGKRLQNGLAVVVIVVAAVVGSEGTGVQAAGKRHVAPGERMAVGHPTTSELAQAAQTYEFNIPARPLLAALANFTAATAVQVVRPDAAPLSGTSQPVSGTFTAAQALARMLVGTGLSARFSGATTVTMERAGPPQVAAVPSEGRPPPAGTVLPVEPVTVQEQRPPSRATSRPAAASAPSSTCRCSTSPSPSRSCPAR